MNTFLMVLLLMQSSVLLPPRTAMEDPATVSQVPLAVRKDYQKLWMRFVASMGDAQLARDLEKLIKKQKNLDPALMIQGYIALYKGDDAGAGQKFQQALALNANNRIALYYLAELAYTHQDYVRANTFYSLLLSIDKNRTDVEPKRLKARLLATDDLLRSAARADGENRLSDAEEFYKQALAMAPKEPAVHLRLADLLARENKVEEAAAERKTAEELLPRRAAAAPNNAEPKVDDLEDLGRWGKDIGRFHEIRNAAALTREQVAALILKYFPQVTERQQTPQIVTDIDTSWARTEIQTVVDLGLLDLFPNHTFAPAASMTREDFATALARLSRLLDLAPSSSAAPISAPDVVSTNPLYRDVQLVLGYGLMGLQDSGGFGVSGKLSGQEAVRATEGLLRIFQQAQH